MGKFVKIIDFFGNVLVSDYDVNSNLIKIILLNGNEVFFFYDGIDWVKLKLYNGIEKYNFMYDKNGNEILVVNKEQNIIKKWIFDNKNCLIELIDCGGS